LPASPRASSARILVAAFGDAGHVFPAIALGKALSSRSHEVVIETWEERRAAVEGEGLGFAAAEEYRMFPPPDPDSEEGQHAAEAAKALLPLLEDFKPHVVVSDILTLAPTLAAERAGIPLATLVPHIYPVVEPGNPFFAIGLRPPRTGLGRRVWRFGHDKALRVGLEQGRRDLNIQRQRLDLPPIDRFHGGISPDLALVATYPQLEYPRRWPAGVEITGPMTFEVPHPEIELPPGDDPLVLIAPSTAHDSDNHLVRTALAALADEPVRVVATTNRVAPQQPLEVPANAKLQPADASRLPRHIPRRPRHRRPRPRRRDADPHLPDHRRHERDRDARRLGGSGAVVAVAALSSSAPEVGVEAVAARALVRHQGPGDCGLGTGERRRGTRGGTGRAPGAQAARRRLRSSGGGTRTHNRSINSRELFH
jgi:UDP:flavonoid glycosyltransferase YjiC (YdhE family)